MQNSFLAGYIVNLHHITEKCRENSIFIHIRHSSIKYNTQFFPIMKFIFIDFFSRTVQLARSSLIYSKKLVFCIFYRESLRYKKSDCTIGQSSSSCTWNMNRTFGTCSQTDRRYFYFSNGRFSTVKNEFFAFFMDIV